MTALSELRQRGSCASPFLGIHIPHHSSPNGDYLEIFRIHKCDFIAPSIVVGP